MKAKGGRRKEESNEGGRMEDERRVPEDLKSRTKRFALQIIRLYSALPKATEAQVLGKHILRAGTSVGAHYREAIGGQSEKDFTAKMRIAYKEARETHYWLRLLNDSGLIEESVFSSIIHDCDELLKLLGSITKTMKGKIRNS